MLTAVSLHARHVFSLQQIMLTDQLLRVSFANQLLTSRSVCWRTCDQSPGAEQRTMVIAS